jgi:transposase
MLIKIQSKQQKIKRMKARKNGRWKKRSSFLEFLSP